MRRSGLSPGACLLGKSSDSVWLSATECGRPQGSARGWGQLDSPRTLGTGSTVHLRQMFLSADPKLEQREGSDLKQRPSNLHSEN